LDKVDKVISLIEKIYNSDEKTASPKTLESKKALFEKIE
jgi:hypothetical protein